MNSLYLVAFQTLVMKEIRRFLRIWPQTLIPPMVSMALYFLIFGTFIGQRIGKMGGFDYVEFIVPGLIMMAVITNAYSNVASSFFGNKFQRAIEAILVSPTPNFVIIAGFVGGGVARGLLVGIMVLIVSTLFVDIRFHDPLVTVLVFLLTAILFSLAGFINGIYADKFDDVSIIPAFVLTPLTYLGGVFYSLEMLPDFWRQLSYLNPIVYVVSTFRYGFYGVSDSIPVAGSIVALLIFTVGLTVWAMWLLNRGTGVRS